MSKKDPSIQDILGGIAAKQRGDTHPDAGLLADYLDDLLNESEMDIIRDHLSVCPACTQTLLAFEEAPAWLKTPSPTGVIPFWRKPLARALVMAALLVLAIGLSLPRMTQGGGVGPTVGGDVLDLYAVDDALKGDGALPAGGSGKHLSLFLATGDFPAGPARLVLFSGKVQVWSDEVAVDESEGCSIVFPPQFLKTGKYRLQLKPVHDEMPVKWFEFVVK